MEAAFDEIEILQKTVNQALNEKWLADLKKFCKEKKIFKRDDCHVIQLLNAFIYTGAYGRHFCMVFEIMGKNLLDLIKVYDHKGIPLKICRKIAKQVLLGLCYLHEYCGIIHTDLKPENIMFCLNKKEMKDIFFEENKNFADKFEDFKRIKENVMKVNSKDFKREDLVFSKDCLINNPEKKCEKKEFVILNDNDLEKEYLRLTKKKPTMTKKDKKNLRRKLKKKLKKNLKKANKETNKAKSIKKEQNTVIQKKNQPLFISKLIKDFKIKIADLGNSCWIHHHFQADIQTRHYRAPEIILGLNYNEKADIWSFACLLIEMLTGEYLFDPKKKDNLDKNDDHITLIIEMLNKFPKILSTSGINSKKYFNENGELKNIKKFYFLHLEEFLVKYHLIKRTEAKALSDFLLLMLELDPKKRKSARELLSHYWLEMDTEEFFYNLEENKENHSFNDLKDFFEVVVDEEDFYADVSYEDEESDSNEEESYEDYYENEIKSFDESFKYGNVFLDGINFEESDNTENWKLDQKLYS